MTEIDYKIEKLFAETLRLSNGRRVILCFER